MQQFALQEKKLQSMRPSGPVQSMHIHTNPKAKPKPWPPPSPKIDNVFAPCPPYFHSTKAANLVDGRVMLNEWFQSQILTRHTKWPPPCHQEPKPQQVFFLFSGSKYEHVCILYI